MEFDTIKVGELSAEVISVLGLNYQAGMPIYLGSSNIAHMQDRHLNDFNRYFAYLSKILEEPDCVGLNYDDNNSIEYVKTLPIVKNNNSVKVAVRISKDGYLFTRTIYEILGRTVNQRLQDGTLKPLMKK